MPQQPKSFSKIYPKYWEKWRHHCNHGVCARGNCMLKGTTLNYIYPLHIVSYLISLRTFWTDLVHGTGHIYGCKMRVTKHKKRNTGSTVMQWHCKCRSNGQYSWLLPWELRIYLLQLFILAQCDLWLARTVAGPIYTPSDISLREVTKFSEQLKTSNINEITL
jgi:hypothetical protein